ncbi:MAG: ATP-binding cassette domain-containing protein [Epsilonproteobacteria bacterium]|nr:ATP-binding cassette domain-containing protein [Campylobacterota bacterium]
MNIVDFENIYVSYDIKPILKNINLKVKEGEHLAILGANGSGKSTLMKLFSNDIYPNTKYEFKKEIFGKQRWGIFELKKKLGIITNDLHNYFEKQGTFLTAYEVVLSGYYSSIGVFKHQDFKKEWHKKALETMEFLDILDIKDKLVFTMSTGQLRKCIIARALVHEPKAFVLDEPTSGLDIKAQISFISLLKKLSKKATIILITHHIEEVFEEIKNIALISEQTIYKIGDKKTIMTNKNLSKTFGIELYVSRRDGRYFYSEIFS